VSTMNKGKQNDGDEVGSPAMWLPDRRSFVRGIVGLGAMITSAPEALSARAIQSQSTASGGEVPPVGGAWGPFTPSSSFGRYLELAYPASPGPGGLQIAVIYRMWLPEKIQKVRAVIVHQHGAGIPAAQAGATSAYDLQWQALAKKWDCALLGPSYHVLNDAIDLTPGGAELWFDPRKGSDMTFLQALKELSTQSGYPEIATAPWVLWGHSGGGIWSNVMSTLHPERVVAVFLRSGTATMFRTMHEFIQPKVPPATYGIPTMVNFGMGEKGRRPYDGSLATFQEYGAQGAPIGFAPDPRTAHECGDSRYLAIPFLDECLRMRLRESSRGLRPLEKSGSWLAKPFDDTAVTAASFKGDPAKAVWLPNEAIAKIWMEYVRTGTVSHSASPPAPVDIRAKVQPDGSVRVSWDAEADYVLGLGGFIVLRDGHGIGRLPSNAPDAVFGRPLFQGLSFHDTPFAPLPQMTHVDSSPQKRAKHAYTVIALSSSGVPSKPSLPALVE
jgi:pimeloyl-ACP methyl ester carboxylesterase